VGRYLPGDEEHEGHIQNLRGLGTRAPTRIPKDKLSCDLQYQAKQKLPKEGTNGCKGSGNVEGVEPARHNLKFETGGGRRCPFQNWGRHVEPERGPGSVNGHFDL
jgi:hypothetical protein